MLDVGTLSLITEAKSDKERKYEENMKKSYNKFKDFNRKFASKHKLDKYDLYDSKGWTAKGGAISGALGGALGGLAVAGPMGATMGAVGGALGGAGGTKLGRYIRYKQYGKYDKKGEVDW